MSFIYPFLDGKTLSALKTIADAARQDATYLKGEDSPNPNWLIDLLSEPQAAEPAQLDPDDGPDWLTSVWFERLLHDLENMRGGDISSLEPAQQNTYIRSATALTQKLVELQERVASAQKAEIFIRETIELLEEMVPENVVGEFMARLRTIVAAEV